MQVKKESLTAKISGVLRGAPKEGLSLKDFVQTLNYRAHAMLTIILCLPFCTPVPLPGVSTVFAVVIFFISAAITLGLPPYLPYGWDKKKFDCSRLLPVFSRAEPWLKRVEKILRPRMIVLAGHPIAVRLHGVLIMLTAILLGLPAPPGGNALPGIAIVALCLALIEEDGLMTMIGIALVGVNIAVFSAIYYFAIDWLLNVW